MELKSRDRETKETWPDCGIVGTDDKEDVSWISEQWHTALLRRKCPKQRSASQSLRDLVTYYDGC
jgi:hypothetical protein